MLLPAHIQTGQSHPMGACARDDGVNFVVFSDHAQTIELCLFDASGAREIRRYALHGPHDGLFQGFLQGVGPGLVYGLRAHGAQRAEAGQRFNPHKLLLDPWAREIVGSFRWHAEHHGHSLGHPDGHRSFDTRDNAILALKARVQDPPGIAPGWLNAPRHAASKLVLYEVHVKGFSQRHPQIAPPLRGSYAGLAQPAAIAHFKSLGVTTLSLLPVHYPLDESGLAERGLVNYWGYNTLGFFCPNPRLASAGASDPADVAQEFRQMVATLHEHGLEVVLDVVYNHTPEGNETGPTLSWRGLDNASWYRLWPDDRSRCDDSTGCGNTLNLAHPRVTQFVLDSLRYWAQHMGVDGFRFDLASVLGRTAHGFDAHAAFFTALRQDPVLARVHLIAEPWDAGAGGYQLGRFPGRFLEWNDKFRDSVRRFWLNPPQRRHDMNVGAGVGAGAGADIGADVGAGVGRGEFARRFTASSDLFHHGQRRPSASVNFITAHDGLALADVVSYRHKHNLANGEGNRDGRDGEPCTDFGVHGPSDDSAVVALRGRVRRAMLATLLLAQGTPMLCAGDEIGKTQRGNNNPWCQDNATSWLDWAQADSAMSAFVAEVLVLRRTEPALCHDSWFHAAHGNTPKGHPGSWTLRWLHPHGHEMQVPDWHDSSSLCFGCVMAGGPAPSQPALLLAFNPDPLDTPFMLPAGEWAVALDTSGELPRDPLLRVAKLLLLPQRSLLVLRQGGAD